MGLEFALAASKGSAWEYFPGFFHCADTLRSLFDADPIVVSNVRNTKSTFGIL